jgi:hypothetical protein
VAVDRPVATRTSDVSRAAGAHRPRTSEQDVGEAISIPPSDFAASATLFLPLGQTQAAIGRAPSADAPLAKLCKLLRYAPEAADEELVAVKQVKPRVQLDQTLRVDAVVRLITERLETCGKPLDQKWKRRD